MGRLAAPGGGLLGHAAGLGLPAGNRFPPRDAAGRSGRPAGIAMLSPDYFASEFGEAEWRAIFAKDPTGERGLLIPVRVREFRPPGLLATRVYIDLVNKNAAEAADALVRGVSELGARPTTEPPFPGPSPTPAVAPWFPGTRPGDRLRPIEGYSSGHDGLTAIWLGLEETRRALPRASRSTPAHSVRSTTCSTRCSSATCTAWCRHTAMAPEWILLTGQDVVAAPPGWVRDRRSRSDGLPLDGPPPRPWKRPVSVKAPRRASTVRRRCRSMPWSPTTIGSEGSSRPTRRP